MRNIEENIATGTQGNTNYYTGKNTAHETTNTHKRKLRHDLNHGENIPDLRSNQRDVSSNNKRRKYDDLIDDTVTNQQGRSLENKTNLHIDDSKVLCKTRHATDQIKQFKIILCEIRSKIKKERGWQLDASCSAVDNLRNGEINFTKEAGQKKWYSFYEVKCVADTKSSKDAKLNYVTFRSDMVQKCFQRYLNFCNCRSPDSLAKFEVCCNIKLNTDAFNRQGIDIERLGSSTYKLEIQETYKNNIEKLGLYKTFLRCCTLPKLADLLIDCMKNNKAHFNTILLQKWLSTFIKEKILEQKDEKDKYIMKFHQDFIEGNNLTESANVLRNLFLSKNMKLRDRMEFTVSKMTFKKYNNYPVEPLPVEMPVDMFHKFLKIFRFKVVNNIDAIVKDTIGEKFIAINNDWYLNAFQEGFRKIVGSGNWDSQQLYQFLEKEIHKCNVIQRLREEPCFQQGNIKFENIGSQRIYRYLTEENKKVVFCLTEYMTITEHRLRQLSNEKFVYSENQESLFINDDILFEITEDVIQGFLSYSLKLLVVLIQKKSPAQLQHVLNDIISESLNLNEDKSVIVVLSTKYLILMKRNHPDIPIIKVDTTFLPLMPESLNQLKQSNVVLHKHEIKMAELMDDAAIAELIKLPEILEQFLNEKLVFKDNLVKPNDFGLLKLKCYETKLRDESKKICKVIDILNCDSQVVIISGRSGIGKSFFLYELAQKTCSEYVSALECGAHFWLNQININELPFKEIISQDKINIFELFAEYLELNDVYKKIFIMSAEGRLKLKLILVIDKYDEVHSAYKDFAMKILHQLKNSSVKKIFIANGDNTIFEPESRVLCYNVEFLGENKKHYRRKYFPSSAVYIDSLAKELTSTPLHLKMLHKINRHHKQNIAIYELHDLYKKYGELKMNSDDIYTFAEFSAQLMLSKKDFKLLNPDFQEKNLNMPFSKDLQHATIYEYFTAWWLSVKFLREAHIRREILTIADKLFQKISVFLSVFLDPTGNESELINGIVEYGCLNLLNFFLRYKVIIAQKPNLHRVIEYNNTNAYEVLKDLFERYKRTDGCQLVEYINQEIDGETPIEVSCRVKNMDVACKLMLEDADVKRLNEDSLVKMTIHVISELTRGNFRFENILEALLELSSEASLTYLNEQREYPKFMKYLLERGQKKIMERLLRKKTNREQLLEMCVDGKLPLDFVNNSQWLDNGKRLEMYKCIIENVGDELNRENKYFIGPVLRGACKTNCKEIFNYFVDRYPGNVNGFLDEALRDNRLEDVKFVVGISKGKRTIDKHRNTLLHRAIRFDAKDDIIEFLIDRIGLHEVNRNKRTALHVAFKTGQEFPRIKYLIDQKASLLATDKYGLYPWCYALLDEYCDYDEDELTEIMNYLIKEKNIEPPKNASLGSKSDAYKKEVTRKLEHFRDSRSSMRDE